MKIEENKNNIVKKHQDLVHTARYSLGELGIKVVSLLISMVKKDDKDFQEYNIRLADFKELIGSNSKKTYEYVDVMTDELMKKPFKIGDTKFNWVYLARYHINDSYVTLKIAPELKPYLLGLQKNFVQYNIKNILFLKSGYVIRLYELLKDKWEQAKRYNPSIKSFKTDLEIKYLRSSFDIPDSYQYSSHIKNRIINMAKKQFKEKTDIQFDYVEQKIGRKVDRLIITIKENNQGSNHHLDTLQSFIKYMRSNFINQDILESKDKNSGKIYMLSVSPKGLLYDKYGSDFKASRSKEMWDKLYSLAKDNKLFCLNQGKLL